MHPMSRIAAALTLALLAAPALAQIVAAPGQDIDTGSKSVRVPSGIEAGRIDTGSGHIRLELGGSRIGGDLIVRKTSYVGWCRGFGEKRPRWRWRSVQAAASRRQGAALQR